MQMTRPRFGQATAQKKCPDALKRLFNAIPKTELHMHLSGSTPLPLLRQFLREENPNMPKDELHRQTQIKRQYTDLNDFLSYYYKVAYHLQTPEQFRRASFAVAKEAAKENVRYLELRTSMSNKQGTPLEILEATEQGLRDGEAWAQQTLGHPLKTAVIILTQRAYPPERTLEDAKMAVEFAKRPHSKIVGFDLGGSEADHAVNIHQAALNYVKQHGLPLTVHAGETEVSQGQSGADSVKQAIALGADRIGHGLQALQDQPLTRQLAQTQMPVELCPVSNVNITSVPSMTAHPLPQFVKENINVSLSTDNRMMSRVTLTDQLVKLYQAGLLPCWETLKQLSYNGVRGAFMPQSVKQNLLTQFQAEFQQLEQRFRPLIQQVFCRPCKHPTSESSQLKTA